MAFAILSYFVIVMQMKLVVVVGTVFPSFRKEIGCGVRGCLFVSLVVFHLLAGISLVRCRVCSFIPGRDLVHTFILSVRSSAAFVCSLCSHSSGYMACAFIHCLQPLASLYVTVYLLVYL